MNTPGRAPRRHDTVGQGHFSNEDARGFTVSELRLTPCVTPHGQLLLTRADDAVELAPDMIRRLQGAFARGPGHGLLRLGAGEVDQALPPVFAYWREFAKLYVSAVCSRPDLEQRHAAISPPPHEELVALVLAGPAMPGGEYISTDVLTSLWNQLDRAFGVELSESGGSVQDFLKRLNPVWNMVGRVHFNLAENRKDEEAPFAFLATYTGQLSVHGTAQHLPLGQALREYAGAANKDRLLSLLLPVQRAAERCAWLKRMVDEGEIFHPLRWSPAQACQLLGDVAELERAGVVVRMPRTWRANRPLRPQVTATVGSDQPAGLGKDALLDFHVEMTLDGEPLTAAEARQILASTTGLALVRGQWVQVDAERLKQTMNRLQEVERLAVAPASLLANWVAEIERFTPDLSAIVAHPSAMQAAQLKELTSDRLVGTDLVITSYGTLLRAPWLESTSWDLIVLDEAQAIKNAGAKQTRAAKKLKSRARIALTGTPVENRLGDLWSIFDFVNPGLLGSAKEFTSYTKRLADRSNPYGPLRDLVRPYILRRLKTDRAIISDLPDKTEVKAYCSLSRRQAALYQQAVDELETQLEGADGIQRKGVVLTFLMRLKQVCNHPSQWLGDGAWAEEDSGKLARLRDLAEVIAAKQEKALVFTQFREVTGPLASFLGSVFGRPGLVLHGETEVKKRKDLVKRFQEDESVPFFVLSLKAGGTGLNLTAASHVVHFDRWWNPAVENQATDRAFRIGQTKNVLVHKFVCRGTVEEKIDRLIESKQHLARQLLEGGAELKLTELSDDELLRLVTLDLSAAMKE
ncbi:MAG: DEAD/DEAH box helicase [Candidatus Riflebacteria bacterium]|nr:DEAD/DEAH box helicase [Candidatus Riflebacteria bacterium]